MAERKNCTRNKKTSKGAGERDRDLEASLKSSQGQSATLNNVHIAPQKTEDSEGGQEGPAPRGKPENSKKAKHGHAQPETRRGKCSMSQQTRQAHRV